jgi:SNF2 family DNA or RNA helicase
MMDMSFSEGQNLQVIGRIERIGQARPMFVYTLTARKTVDEYIRKKLDKRREMIGEVLGEDERLTVSEVIEAIE